MPALNFVTQSSRSADDIGYSPERLVNVYPEAGPQNAKGPVVLRSVLGRATFATTSKPIVRAMEFFNNRIYLVSGGRLFSMQENATVTNHAAITDDVISTISSSGDLITIAAGGTYYVWNLDTSTLSTPGSGKITNVGTVGLMDHYTLLTEQGGDFIEWTTQADPETRNALFFARNESQNDDTLRVMTDRLYPWFFGQTSTEVFYNTGLSGADAFLRVTGGALETGILAANLATKTEEGLFFIGDDKVAYLTIDAQLRAVSTPAVNEAIDGETPSHCFYYEDRGHRFCVVRFANRPAWIYDMATGLWHERSSGTNLAAWDVIDAVKAWSSVWYCVTTDGTVYSMTRANTDVTDPLKRWMTSSSLYLEGNQFSISELELLGEFGESASEATIMFELSRDGGRTFGNVMTRSAGTLGDRELRVVLRALGRQRNFVVRVTVTDATDLNIYSQMNVRVS